MILLLSYALSILFWNLNKRAISLVFFYVAITNGFNLKIIATNYDLTYLSFAFGTYAVISYARQNKANLFKLNPENCIVWLYGFIAIHFFFTVLLGIDTLKYSFIVFRQWGIIGVFLLFRKFTIKEIDDSLKYILVITFFWLFLYYLQFFGINLFIEERFITAFKRNTPFLCLFFAIYIFCYYDNKIKWLLIAPLLWTCVTAGSRGGLTGIIMSVVIFYSLIKKSKKTLALGLIILLGHNYILDFFKSDTFSRNEGISFIDELENGFSTDYKHFHGVMLDGTFAYRTLYLYERFDYLLDHPQNIPFGIGSIYETSPNNNMHFFIQDSGKIETDDLFWATPLLRYGFIGISLYLIFFITYFRFFRYKNLDDKTVQIGMVFFMMLLFTSMGTWSFARPENIMAMGMCYYKVKKMTEQKLL